MDNMKSLSCAANGLRDVQAFFFKHQREEPDLRAPAELVELFKKVKLISGFEETVTSRYNTAILIQWVIEKLTAINTDVFQLPASPLHVALTLLALMQLSQFLKAAVAKETNEQQKLKQTFLRLVEEARQNCRNLSRQIRNGQCSMVSQNTRKSKDVLLLRRGEVLEKDEQLMSPLMQLDLHCVFSNILLNLRRAIRQAWSQRQGEIRQHFRVLKVLEVILYYLSAITFAPLEEIVRAMANDTLNQDRQYTYIHLLHDEDGLMKFSLYLKQAPLMFLESDMDLLSNLVNQQAKK